VGDSEEAIDGHKRKEIVFFRAPRPGEDGTAKPKRRKRVSKTSFDMRY